MPIHPHAAAVVLAAVLLGTGARAEDAARPPVPDWQTDAQSCRWEWREGGGLGLWTESCAFSTGLWEVVWSAEEGAFVLTVDGALYGRVVQPFALPEAEGIGALPGLLAAAGALPADAPCAMEPAALRPLPRTMAVHVLTPTVPGAFDPTPEGDVPDPLCGPYGASTHGVRYFVTDLRWPGLAVFVEEGQERPKFDPSSLTLLPTG